jgi:hypothetical protein
MRCDAMRLSRNECTRTQLLKIAHCPLPHAKKPHLALSNQYAKELARAQTGSDRPSSLDVEIVMEGSDGV